MGNPSHLSHDSKSKDTPKGALSNVPSPNDTSFPRGVVVRSVDTVSGQLFETHRTKYKVRWTAPATCTKPILTGPKFCF